MITTTYKLKHIETIIEEDSYNDGCIPETTVSKGRINFFDIIFTGNNKRDIATNISMLFEHDIKSEDITIDRDNESTFVRLNLLENNFGHEPTSHAIAQWKAGRIKLYNASYKWEFTKETVETAVEITG